jgi:AcrR family transcriptional regulator
MIKTDRRVRRTREVLQKALMDLIHECDYDAITVQDIVDRANVGRTTFYLHYNSKEDLFMSCHEAIVSEFHLGPHHPLSRDELLSPKAPAGTASAYRHLAEVRTVLHPIFQGKDSQLIVQRMREWSAQEIEASLHAAFGGARSTIPLDVLAHYLAGARIALVQWWLKQRQSHSPEELAQSFHRLQRAAIRDAFEVDEAE